MFQINFVIRKVKVGLVRFSKRVASVVFILFLIFIVNTIQEEKIRDFRFFQALNFLVVQCGEHFCPVGASFVDILFLFVSRLDGFKVSILLDLVQLSDGLIFFHVFGNFEIVRKILRQGFYQVGIVVEFFLEKIVDESTQLGFVSYFRARAVGLFDDIEPKFVECPRLYLDSELALNTVSHFLGALFCKRKKQDIFRVNGLLFAKVFHLRGNCKRFTATCASQHEDAVFVVDDGRALLHVQRFAVNIRKHFVATFGLFLNEYCV